VPKTTQNEKIRALNLVTRGQWKRSLKVQHSYTTAFSLARNVIESWFKGVCIPALVFGANKGNYHRPFLVQLAPV